MTKLDPTKIITYGQGGHGTAEKLTVQTHGIECCRKRLKIEGETEEEISPPLCLVVLVRAVRIRRSSRLLRSPCSFDNKVSRKTKGRKRKYYEGKEKERNLK